MRVSFCARSDGKRDPAAAGVRTRTGVRDAGRRYWLALSLASNGALMRSQVDLSVMLDTSNTAGTARPVSWPNAPTKDRATLVDAATTGMSVVCW